MGIAFTPLILWIAQTEALQQRRRLGILRRRVLYSGIGYGRDLSSPCILLLAELRSIIAVGPDLCSCILHGAGPSLLFRGPDLCRGILRHP